MIVSSTTGRRVPNWFASAFKFIARSQRCAGEAQRRRPSTLVRQWLTSMNSTDERVLVERQSPYHYTQDGLELKERADQALIPLFLEFMGRGYSPYQICAVIHDGVAETSRDIVGVHKTAGKEAADKMLEEKLKS